jgi:DNA-binding transcriptional regulator YdaS (Cro superfamily)
MDSVIDKAILAAGGPASLAARLGTSRQVVSNWRRRGQIPAGQCRAVEEAVGGKVTCQDLRPDVFGKVSRSKPRRKAS